MPDSSGTSRSLSSRSASGGLLADRAEKFLWYDAPK
jgi:hypothetical protein